MSTESSTVYSRDDVLENKYLIIGNDVYDVKKFLDFHPGGKQIIVQNLGTDVSEAFTSEAVHVHSQKAFRMLNRYKIGVLDRGLNNSDAQSTSSEGLTHLVDFSKPVLPQVINMEPSMYQKWLHNFPTQTTMRIFQSDFMESLSRYPWFYIFPLWVPVILYNVYLSYIEGYHIFSLLVSFLCGWFIWTGIEYTLHRFCFHVDTNSVIGNFYHFFAHGIHHLTPLDETRLTFPPHFSIIMVASIYYVLTCLPIPAVNAMFAGGLLGYITYDGLHFWFHHGTMFQNVPFLNWMKTRHLQHHYVNPERNFGVTSPLFDILFGTSADTKSSRVQAH